MAFDPIKLNIMSRDGQVSYSIIIVGEVPADVERTLSSGKHDARILENYYGKSWRRKLFLGDKRGGDDYFSLDELDLLTAETAPEEAAVPETPSKHGIHYSFVNVFSFDTVLEFKQKVEFITKIPLFAQYICYFFNKTYISCMYTIEFKGQVIHPNIFRAIKSSNERIENVPINKTFSSIGGAAKIKTYDFAVVMDELKAKYEAREFYLFDMRQFLDENLCQKLANSGNETELKVIYYGFIMPYFPVLTYQVFVDYVKFSYKDFIQRYPHVINGHDYKKVIDTESEITFQALEFAENAKKYKCVRDKVITGIESCILQVFTKYTKSVVVHIRNLFDILPLNDQIVAASCIISHEGGRYILRKTYKKNVGIKFQQELNQLTYKIRYNTQTTEFFNLTFNRNGNYFISSNFLEEYAYDFHDIVNVLSKIVNPLIERINGLRGSVLIGNNKLDPMRFQNVKFIEVKMFIIWKTPVSLTNYAAYMEILSQFSKARIITPVDSTAEYDKFYYNKGVYQINVERIEKNIDVNNYYAFLTDPKVRHIVLSLFKQNRVMYVANRNFDMRISIEGIRDKEFTTYLNYLLFSLYQFSNKFIRETNHQTSSKSIKSLKSQDPSLYNFKKLYNTSIPYSKICQKPFQPIILDPSDKRKGAVKFWNFTTKTSTYYYCPNPKYPNLTFLVKKHPKDYCIPCCKKKDMNESVSKSDIFKKCLDEHIYTDKKVTIETRYIMNYGKFIEPGRLCRLPEKFMKTFVYNSFTTAVPQKEYYIYGVPQNTNSIRNTGILSSLVIIMEKELSEIIKEMTAEINKKKHLFSVLLNGSIYRYFNSHRDFCQSFHDTFISSAITTSDIPWHDIIKDVLFFFLDINVIEFIDFVPYNGNISDISINLPSNITSGSDILTSPRSIVLMRKMANVFPIFQVNSQHYFSSGIIDKKIFGPDDQIIDVISHLVDYYKNKESTSANTLELSDIIQFCQAQKDYSISGIFINKSNLCYMVAINQDKLYIPVKYVFHKAAKGINVYYETFRRSGKNSMKMLNEFLLKYNTWIIQQNKHLRREPTYKTVSVDYWLVLDPLSGNKEKKVIGFRFQDLNFYVELKLKEALALKKAKLVRLYYEPDTLNRVAFEEPPPQEDNRSMNIYDDLYQYHSYSLFVLKFMSYFNQSKNTAFRKFIHNKLENSDENIIGILNEELLKIYLHEYSQAPAKKVLIQQFDEEASLISHFKLFFLNDMSKLEAQIKEYMKNNITLENLHQIIDTSSYAFDFIEIHRLKNMPFEKARQALAATAKKLFTIKKNPHFKETNFPNIFSSCDSRNSATFCDKDKLIVDKKYFDDYLDIFLQDLLNPLKEQWLFNIMFAENVFSFFEFINRQNENIEVTQLW